METVQKTGIIMQIQHFSVNDGGGIRSTVFMADCPLRCRWCCNPEGLDCKQKLGFYLKLCVGCNRCVSVCPQGIGRDLNAPGARTRCTACGLCAGVCPSGARKQMLFPITVQQLVQELTPHISFYRESGGGVTFSGGEATRQKEFLHAAASRLYDMGLHLALETCGLFDFAELEPTLRLFQLIFFDLKHTDCATHQQFTGQPNDLILRNLAALSHLPAEIVVRVPVILGVNADEENLRRTAQLVKATLPRASMELLPYHRFGEEKYEALGLPLPVSAFGTPEPQLMQQLETILESEGISVVRFR